MNLYEQYRPRSWSDVVGQDKAVAVCRQAVATGTVGGRAWWITGGSGQGKTTTARLLAAEVASDWCTFSMDATRLRVGDVTDMERQMRLYGLGKGGWAWIIDEAHKLRSDVVTALNTALEPMGGIPAHVVIIFTTTADGMSLFEDKDDAGPLLSRCTRIALSRRDVAAAYAARLKWIMGQEGCDGKPIEHYLSVVRSCRNNLRDAIMTESSAALNAV